MTNEETKQLCLDLIHANTEDEVINILKKHDFWDDPTIWRCYSNKENNYSIIGVQQNNPEAALVEKLINSIDARLMNECQMKKIKLESERAPKTMLHAVAQFFEENPNKMNAGMISSWSDNKKNEISKGITLCATGLKPESGKPSLTISDCGEGQTPDKIPSTFLSLTESNKLRIPFVQGKFNMGGTGVLRFCGKKNFQLILTKRNPFIDEKKSKKDFEWGFTIVRRENPSDSRRNSMYTYLAPVNIQKNRDGDILSFNSENMPIFPEGNKPYTRTAKYGTLIKLYEFAFSNTKSHILRKGGLKSKLELLLANPALPIRIHECRKYKGHQGSFDTTLIGLKVRLDTIKSDNLEDNFPTSFSMALGEDKISGTIYAFKIDKVKTYKKNEGVIFTYNGQTHAYFTANFFRRKSVGLNYIADSILIILDCSKLQPRSFEDLFMNDRGRLSNCELKEEIESNLEDELKKNILLKELKEKRRREMVDEKVDNDQALENVLKNLISKYPTISSLFSIGNRLANPFKSKSVASENIEYKGNKFPTYFKFKDKEYGYKLDKNCHINYKSRITFETDASNDYLDRELEKGEKELFQIINNEHKIYSMYNNLSLNNGIGILSLKLPKDCNVGDKIEFVLKVNDQTQINAFENYFTITVKEEHQANGTKGIRRNPPSKNEGLGRESPAGISFPKIIEVREDEFEKYHFNEYTALEIKYVGDNESTPIYDFFINMDNFYLKHELKRSKKQIKAI